jgi:LacI family transcriptional regulator, gluconate utilization system Gnt-I transcriptional repressor
VMECHRRGWAVPSRIAIAGFGDFEVASCASPTITTVGVHCYDIGNRAGSLLLRAIEQQRENRIMAPETIITEFSVIPRESA